MAVGAVKAEHAALGLVPAQVQRDDIIRTGGTMPSISLLGGGATVAVGHLASVTAAGAARDIRKGSV